MSQSVDRAAAILDACAPGPQRLTHLAELLGVHRSTVLRLLQTLERHRLVRRLDDLTWTIGYGLIGLAVETLDRMDLRTAARPRLERLGQEIGHTIHLAQLDGHDIVYVDKVEGRGAVRMASRIGAPVQVHTAGVAKAILAGLPPDRCEAVLASATFERFTDSTITGRAEFAAELAKVRKQGYAVDDGEYESYLACVAVPVRDGGGAIRAGVSITALCAIERLEKLRRHLPRLWTVASEISQELGWTGPAGVGRSAG
ncbi:IclR family transcriptional regulator [Umezawaea tangerina]|uniref:IclR family transcriptional regulator n=1 Tax=Umezawaea tangerina TaxID=84725 RepID=A0A2T0TG98_9PSEU|nr:IclR family transcriptional regulator [Umezawaea tangerina]PRY44707.1 IclR family transcriptional regulator [Umezawaea tangerina]